MVKNNQKIFIYAFFFSVWAPPNGPRKVLKGMQVSEMYGSMSKIKNKPLTNSLQPFFQEKWSDTTRKTLCENGEKHQICRKQQEMGIKQMCRMPI
jgi:hypothetical protein